jgi:glycine oxidase
MSDVIVIGGGLQGLLSARMLLASGKSVTLLEQGRCYGESSCAAAGILSPLYPWRYPDRINRLCDDSMKLFPEICESLEKTTGVDCEFYSCGLLLPGLEDLSLACHWLEKAGRQFQRQPELAGYAVSAQNNLYIPDVANIDNRKLGTALLAQLEQEKCFTLKESTEVSRVQEETQHVQVTVSSGEVLQAGQVLVCAGAWSSQLLPQASGVNIEPVKGEMLMYVLEPGEIPSMLIADGRYIVPRKDGRVLVGSSQERIGFDKSPTTATRKSLQEFAESYIPALAGKEPEDHWAGLRPGADVNGPYIGRVEEKKQIFVNAGHFRNGIAMAPASAKEVVDLMLEGAS